MPTWLVSGESSLLACRQLPSHYVHICSGKRERARELPGIFSSAQFSCSVMSDSLGPHGLQHSRPPCPSPTPGVYPNSCPLSQWCHPTISSSDIPFSSCLQSFPASGSFQMSQFFTSGGHSIGVSASASVLPKNIQDWFPLRWTSWISLQSKGHRNTSRQKIGQLFLISLLRVKLSSENSWKKTHKLLIRSRLYVHL